MSRFRLSIRTRPVVGAACLVVGFAVSTFWVHAAVQSAGSAPPPTTVAPKEDPARSIAAFQKIATVLRHPRCINCHTVTDFPRQGDAGTPHTMSVLRGPDNHGTPAMQCLSCHRDANQRNGVPGAPHWGIAPLSQGWEGLDDHQLAEALKNRGKNGDRSLEKLYEHMAHDQLVAWAWTPGGKRLTPPIGHAEFADLVREWINHGAVSPPPSGKTK